MINVSCTLYSCVGELGSINRVRDGRLAIKYSMLVGRIASRDRLDEVGVLVSITEQLRDPR